MNFNRYLQRKKDDKFKMQQIFERKYFPTSDQIYANNTAVIKNFRNDWFPVPRLCKRHFHTFSYRVTILIPTENISSFNIPSRIKPNFKDFDCPTLTISYQVKLMKILDHPE